MLLNSFTFHAPKTVSELVQLHGSLEKAKLQAGGTFLLNSLKFLKRKGTKTPEHIISLRKVEALKGLSADKEKLEIRSMTTITEIMESSLLRDNFSVLRTVCRNISTTPIRNMATIGGNLTCRYTWTEMPAVMIGLEADMHFIGSDGQEEVLPAEEFFKNGAKTGKILTHVTIRRDQKCAMAYRRVKKSPFIDIPLLSVFIKTSFQENRFTATCVSVNNGVAFAQRDRILEDFLNQRPRLEETAAEALNHLDHTIYDNRSHDYKKYMFQTSIESALEELIEGQNR